MKKALLSLLFGLVALPMAFGQAVVVDDTTMCAPLKWRNNQTFTRDTAVVLTTDTVIYVLQYKRPAFDTTALKGKTIEVSGECVANWNDKTWTRPGTFLDTTLTGTGATAKCVVKRVHITLATTDSVETVAACGSYTTPWGDVFTAPTSAQIDTAIVHGECTYVKHLTLTVTPEYALHDVQVEAECSYQWNDSIIRDFNQHVDTLKTVTYQCDSIVRLQVTSFSGLEHDTTHVVSCDSLLADSYIYTWDTTILHSGLYTYDTIYGKYPTTTGTANCAHKKTLDVTIVASVRDTNLITPVEVVAACAYTWAGHTFTYPDTVNHFDTLSTVIGGCDSVAGIRVTQYTGQLYDTNSVRQCGSKYTWKNSAFAGQPGYNNGFSFTHDVDTTVSITNTTNNCTTNYTLSLRFYTKHDTVLGNYCGYESYTYSGYKVLNSDGSYVNGPATQFDTTGYYSVNHNGDSLYGVSNGCATSHTIKVTIKRPAIEGDSNVVNTVNTCGLDYSYTVGGIPFTFTESVDTIIRLEDHTFLSCTDMISHLDLTLRKPTFHIDSIERCDSYTWTIDSVTYTSNVKIDVKAKVKNTVGCDSTDRLVLTIHYTPAVDITGKWVLTPGESTMLRAVADMPISNYAWYVNNEASPRAQGAHADSLELTNVTANTDVHLISTSTEGCVANNWLTISATVGIDDFDNLQANLYPNPTDRFLTIESAAGISQVEIYNTVGQKVLERRGNSELMQLDLGNLTSGTYSLRITGADGQQTHRKIIVNK